MLKKNKAQLALLKTPARGVIVLNPSVALNQQAKRELAEAADLDDRLSQTLEDLASGPLAAATENALAAAIPASLALYPDDDEDWDDNTIQGAAEVIKQLAIEALTLPTGSTGVLNRPRRIHKRRMSDFAYKFVYMII